MIKVAFQVVWRRYFPWFRLSLTLMTFHSIFMVEMGKIHLTRTFTNITVLLVRKMK